jgi:hypothetical protein
MVWHSQAIALRRYQFIATMYISRLIDMIFLILHNVAEVLAQVSAMKHVDSGPSQEHDTDFAMRIEVDPRWPLIGTPIS